MAEKSKINHQGFINPRDFREYLREPFVFRGYAIYTNGHVLCMHPDGGPDSIPEQLSESFPSIIEKVITNKDWQPLPTLELKSQQCKVCEGGGKVKFADCDECDGDGEIEWTTLRHHYEAECKECDGTGGHEIPGKVSDCSKCGGSGGVFDDRHIMLGESGFDPKYITKIQAEGTEINQPGENEMLVFRNGDTLGIIMNMRV